jgi:hypothetical protein
MELEKCISADMSDEPDYMVLHFETREHRGACGFAGELATSPSGHPCHGSAKVLIPETRCKNKCSLGLILNEYSSLGLQ